MSHSSKMSDVVSGRAGGRAPRVGLLGRAGATARGMIAPLRARGWEVIYLAGPPSAAMLARLGAIVLLLDPEALASAELLSPLIESAAATGVGLVACTAATTTPAVRVAGLQAGLDGWIEVDSDPREAVARLSALMRPRLERTRSERTILAGGGLEVRRDLLDAVADGRRATLTTREFELLELLAGGAGSVVSREEIHRALWHREPPPGDRTVDVLVSRIRRKLRGVAPDWRYLHTHPGAGYGFAAEPLAAPELAVA
jgi:two-component system, OmpR family, torCAD operon response regulator TorR